jgi:threonine dehydrogenase-like Zn-dependent dehydrogenase
MKAIRFNASIPRYAATVALGRIKKDAYYKGPLATTYMDDVPEPALVNDDWVKIQTIYGGVCGSDLNLIFLLNTTYSEPFVTMPFTPGHENVGRIVEVGKNVRGFSEGDRVVVDPMLPCPARDIDPMCGPCSRGDFSQCLNLREGSLPPGFYTGLGSPVGGSWSEYFVAHKSQLFSVPDAMTDEQALMLEALSICMHAVIRNLPDESQTVLVYGCGIIGMLIVASLKALVPACRVIAVARYPFQAQVVRGFGADEVIMQREVDDIYTAVAGLTGAQVLKPMIGGRYLNGGPDTVFDCVGHRDTIDNSFRMTRSGGRVVMIGAAGVVGGIDWTPVWFKELTIRGTLCSSTDTFEGETKRTFEWSRDMISSGRIDVDQLLTHVWKLDRFTDMIETATSKGDNGCIKQAFKLS